MPNFVLLSLLVSLGVSLLLVLTQRWHGRFSMDHTSGVQKFHTAPTPRIGGVGVVAGVVAGLALSSTDVKALLHPLLLAGVPAFAAGLLEDITKKVGVAARLLATMVSGALACWLTGVVLDRADVPGLDALMTMAPFAVLFTAFAVAGVANAINIVDGFNGLSTGAVMITLAALGLVAQQQNDPALALTCAALAAAVLGFWLVNFPLGKIFLGDGGAYFAGFAAAWLGVLLVMRHPSVSPWVVLLACSYPVTEVLYSVWRRKRQRRPTGAPDSLHLHSLVKTQVVLRLVPHWPARLRNAAVSPFMWGYAVVPAGLAVLLHNSPVWMQVLSWLGCVLWYHLSYQFLARRAQLNPIHDSAVAPLEPEPPGSLP